jgi:hypothetical protein
MVSTAPPRTRRPCPGEPLRATFARVNQEAAAMAVAGEATAPAATPAALQDRNSRRDIAPWLPWSSLSVTTTLKTDSDP